MVTCTPSASGPQTGTLVVMTNEPGGPSYTYTLSCAAALPGIVLTPSSLGFGNQPIAQQRCAARHAAQQRHCIIAGR